jgi:alkaline phosphatase isozyme conversion protein
MGLGVMLELAEHLKNVPTRYGIRFIATSGEEEGRLGAQNLLQRMSEAEKKNTLLVINLDNLVVGDKLYFNSGRHAGLGAQADPRSRAGYRPQQRHCRLHQSGTQSGLPERHQLL